MLSIIIGTLDVCDLGTLEDTCQCNQLACITTTSTINGYYMYDSTTESGHVLTVTHVIYYYFEVTARMPLLYFGNSMHQHN